MEEQETGVAIAMWIIKILVFVYDIVSLPVYFFLQKPWGKWKKDSLIFATRVKQDDLSSPFVKIPVRKTEQRFHGVETMDQLFRYVVKKYGDKPLFATREKLGDQDEVQKNGKVFKKLILGNYMWLTYKQADRRVQNFSQGLLSLGIKPQQRIAILAETRVEWMIAAQACFRVNIPVVTLYATLGDEGMMHVINETEITHLITSQELLPKVQKILPKLPTVKCIVYMEGIHPMKAAFNNTVKVMEFKEVEILGETKIPDIAGETPLPDDTIIVMYTSGSTGVPKGVVISHKNMMMVAQGFESICPEPLPHDLYIAYLPLAHSLEMTAECFFMSIGVPIGYSSPNTLTDRSTAVRAQDRGDAIMLKPTVLITVPLVLDKICKGIIETVSAKGAFSKLLFVHFLKYKQFWTQRGFQTPILNWLMFDKIKAMVGGSVRCVGCGGAPLSAETQDFIKSCLDCPTLQGYGLTETSAGATIMELDDQSTGRIGSPLPGCYIKLVNWEEGCYRITDQPNPRGEIVIGGNSVTPGYFKNPELTKESFMEEDGIKWFFSGDIGEAFPNGTFKIIDRKKDLLKLQHGEYVSLSRIEAELTTCLIVENICVYGSSLKEYLVAMVVPNRNRLKNLADTLGKGHLQMNEMCKDPLVESEVCKMILEHCRNRKLMRPEIPQKYKVCAEDWLPDNGLLTAAYKLRRKAIQDFYQQDVDRMYSS